MGMVQVTALGQLPPARVLTLSCPSVPEDMTCPEVMGDYVDLGLAVNNYGFWVVHCCWRLEDKCPSLPDDARCHGVLQGEAEDDIVKLPTEILPLIFFYLPYSDLLSVRVTHKNWQKLSQDEGLLKSIATRDFTWAPDLIQHLLPFLEITSEDRINHSSTLGLYKLCPEISYERKAVL